MKEKCKYKIKVFKLKCFNSKFALDYSNCVSWYWSCQEDSRGTPGQGETGEHEGDQGVPELEHQMC